MARLRRRWGGPGAPWKRARPGPPPVPVSVLGQRRFSARFTFLPDADSSSVFHSFDELRDV